MVDLNKITTVGELNKAIEENNITSTQTQEIFITKFTRGIFKAIDLLRKLVDEKEKIESDGK